MKCPVCHFEDTKVIDSRVSGDGFLIRRRRECLKCEFRFSTHEEMEILDLVIVKRDDRRENYDREKIVSGLRKALEKRGFDEEKFKKLIYCIERDLQILNRNEVSSIEVGEIVMKNLKKTDKVAYIRYASVYQSFEGLEEFSEELDKLLKNKKSK
ncbi:transcriptional regulator NrdR [Candidatus Falkowbacteria bacterium HGW-Falkowbacteria-1]|jgi:transcriptional repressor NrdR|uniref:Transcriptional repressor NrdR n=1 Tax=Candidatus Falkowbacteria bacterium HGW-Falkowbacteria-1 TaxID=2013768 RepID=A0A2N2E8U2_9BACT|nr:MAG: transcriptional regulator NrdR [Candidatus Falkowbacteria bacterium HGW-Falkowbacteria-1]